MKQILAALITLPFLVTGISAEAANLDKKIQNIESNISRYEQNLDKSRKRLNASDNARQKKKYETQIKNRLNRIRKAERRLAYLQERNGGQIKSDQVTVTAKRNDPNVVLSWKSPQDTVIGYYIYAGDTENKTNQLVTELTDFNVTSPRHSIDLDRDIQRSASNKVCFRIKAYSNTAVSDYSDAVCTSYGS